MADDAAGASWEEQKAKWGARGARGMRTCAPGRECLADGRTGRQALEDVGGNEAPEDAFVRGLAEARAEKERRRASRGGEGSRASQRRRKRAGAGGAAAASAPAPAPARAPAPAPAAAARKPVPAAKPRATPRPQKRRSGETAGDADKPKRARKSSVSAGVSSLFLTSPTTHTHAQSAAAAAPRNLGEGLWVRDTAAGTGASAEAGATVAVLYTCRLHATNKRVDHRSNPNSPFTFILGRGAVVEGLDRGLEGMAVGGERELVVPAHLGYGAAGAPPKIPPDAALHFAIKLLRVGDGEDAAKGGKRRRARGARGGARAAKKKLAAKLRAAGEK
ncbi:unnamed protein product [Pelagomonas calceolata]|uniref:peptidylprolyl isomerase n=2 Tax=Pelagomonas calceolata TaxID=35677 RepID=A0A8J2S739_9STRA|nr:unnamed protein product [Pelagomonas calceolata]